MYILLAILVFGILIAVHELGHFLVAKACGVRVDEFAIGMGPAIWKKQKGETLYAVRCLPIGGFCAMAGEDEAIDDPRAFTSQPAWKRFLILCAGAFMNFVFGLLLLLIVFAQAKSFSTPTLTDFMDGCPYQGEDALQVGDTIWSIDGHRIYFTTNVSEYLARGGDTHDIVVKRDGEKVALNDFYLVAREYPGQDGKMYGFYFGTKPATFGAKLQTTWYSAMDFVRMVWMGLSDLFAMSALFHLCDLPHSFKGGRRHMVIFVHNDHPVFLCKGLAPPPNRECSCSIRVYSFPLYGILCPYSTPSLDAAFAERIVIFAPQLFLSGIPDISSKSNPVI